MSRFIALGAPILLLVLPGCIARTAANIVTMPVRAGGQVVDWSTTSQEEADRNYGRKMRKQEARQAREQKQEEERRRRECRRAGYDDCG